MKAGQNNKYDITNLLKVLCRFANQNPIKVGEESF